MPQDSHIGNSLPLVDTHCPGSGRNSISPPPVEWLSQANLHLEDTRSTAFDRLLTKQFETEFSDRIATRELPERDGFAKTPNLICRLAKREAPESGAGGLLRCVPRANRDNRDRRVAHCKPNNPIRSHGDASRDIHVPRFGAARQRIAPLVAGRTGIFPNMRWRGDTSSRDPASHQTMRSMSG